MSKNNLTSFGETIKKLRVNNKMPQRKVAAMLDIDTSILSKFEKNIRKPTIEQIEKFAKIFGVDKDSLFFEAITDKIANQFIEQKIDKKIIDAANFKVKQLQSKSQTSK